MGLINSLCDGIGGADRKNAQYSDSLLEWMLAVGASPSAGGARAPLADILSHVGTEVERLFLTPAIAPENIFRPPVGTCVAFVLTMH